MIADVHHIFSAISEPTESPLTHLAPRFFRTRAVLFFKENPLSGMTEEGFGRYVRDNVALGHDPIKGTGYGGGQGLGKGAIAHARTCEGVEPIDPHSILDQHSSVERRESPPQAVPRDPELLLFGTPVFYRAGERDNSGKEGILKTLVHLGLFMKWSRVARGLEVCKPVGRHGFASAKGRHDTGRVAHDIALSVDILALLFFDKVHSLVVPDAFDYILDLTRLLVGEIRRQGQTECGFGVVFLSRVKVVQMLLKKLVVDFDVHGDISLSFRLEEVKSYNSRDRTRRQVLQPSTAAF